MTATTMHNDWVTKNQQYLISCIAQVKRLLNRHIEKNGNNNNDDKDDDELSIQDPVWDDDSDSRKPAIEYVCKVFGLSRFERFVLILCAAIELDSEVSQLCAKAHGNHSAAHPTFSLALAAFPNAHWSALSPVSPLRLFRLIGLYGLPQTPITKCPIQIEERVLHYLAGVSYIDKLLQGVITNEILIEDLLLSESQKLVGSSLIHAWRNDKKNRYHFQLVGRDEISKKCVAGWVCRQIGIMLVQMDGELITQQQQQQQLEIEQIAQTWNRELALMNSALYVSVAELEPASHKIIKRLLSNISGPVFLSTNDPLKDSGSMFLSFDVDKPTKIEQRNLWKFFLEKNGNTTTTTTANTFTVAENDPSQIEEQIRKVVNQFNLNTSSIQLAASEALCAIDRGDNLHNALWSASQMIARPRLLELAQRIRPKASMNDLVLPEKEKQLLRSIIANVKQRYRVYEEWSFGDSQRGLGIAVLFCGDSGTGKTMAAEVMAHELELDLFRIDLSMAVSKYIGETEKNLRKIFDAAEDGGAILLFDEADALFGKRSEAIRDSHDRYANIEVSYLLQRMEAYSGLAILTTNMKDALDKAFLRRLRFIVNFPFPNEKSRKEIWKRVFPRSVPLNRLDYDWLAQLEIAGGHIRNIAVGASMMAANQDTAVSMIHIAHAAKDEYDKMERPMPNGRWEAS